MYCTSVGSKFLTELFSLEFGFRVCVPSFVDFICRACLILRTCSTVLFLGKYRVGQWKPMLKECVSEHWCSNQTEYSLPNPLLGRYCLPPPAKGKVHTAFTYIHTYLSISFLVGTAVERMYYTLDSLLLRGRCTDCVYMAFEMFCHLLWNSCRICFFDLFFCFPLPASFRQQFLHFVNGWNSSVGCDSLLLFVLINLFFRCLVLLSISTILLTIEHPDLSVSYFIHICRECGYACAYHCRSFACEPAINHLTNLLSSFPGVRLVACSTITVLIIYFSFLSVYSFCYVSYAYRKCGVPPLSHLFLISFSHRKGSVRSSSSFLVLPIHTPLLSLFVAVPLVDPLLYTYLSTSAFSFNS